MLNLCVKTYVILSRNRNMKIKDKLSKEQRKALKEIQQINNNTKVYPVDKASVFIVLSEGDTINKIEEYLVRTEVIYKDLT